MKLQSTTENEAIFYPHASKIDKRATVYIYRQSKSKCDTWYFCTDMNSIKFMKINVKCQVVITDPYVGSIM